jgi:hypothetical protein
VPITDANRVQLSGANTAVATFNAPSAGPVAFQLVVTGEAGTSEPVKVMVDIGSPQDPGTDPGTDPETDPGTDPARTRARTRAIPRRRSWPTPVRIRRCAAGHREPRRLGEHARG